jgi:hypothetical protein
VLDPRVYRAGFLPLLLAVVVVAFSLQDAPKGSISTLSAQAFDGRAASAQVDEWSADPRLRDRRPGSAGDRALAAEMVRGLRRQGFTIRREERTGRTVDGRRGLLSVLASRPGISDRAVVVAADRSALDAPGRPSLTASAAMLEMARVLGGRSLDRTLILASISGGPGGAGTAALADELGVPVDAVLVLGPLGGGPERRPWIVPFSDGSEFAPLGLRRTVEDAVRTEVGGAAGRPSIAQQFGRLAFPLTLGAQGSLLDRGIPSVGLTSAGELGPGAGERVAPVLFERFGRAALRATTALDSGATVAPPSRYLVVAGQVLPPWTVRLITGTLLLPLLLGVGDGLARVRRRKGRPARWLGWVLAGVAPFALAAVLARLLGLTGVVAAPPSAVGAGEVPVGAGGIVTLVLVAVILVGGWLGLRRAAGRALGLSAPAEAPAAAAAAAALGLLMAIALWIANPYAAALVIPALHIWLLVTAPETRPRRRIAVALALAGALPAVLVALGYALTFGLGPFDLVWTGLLAVAGGAVGPAAALAWCGVLGTFGSVLAITGRIAPAPAEPAAPVTVRGPRSYAGPGSLGGTESALRR